jgi:hypothetical protein
MSVSSVALGLLAACALVAPSVHSQSPSLSFWLADGDGATEDHIVTYNDITGLGSMPLVDSMNVTWGWPGDLIEIGGVIYGCDTFCEMIWTFDPVTGLVTPVSASAGNPGWDTRLGSLAYDPVAELLYAFDWGGSQNDLFVFDPATVSWIGHLPDLPFSNVRGLAWNVADSLLYLYDAATGQIHTLDPQTGGSSFVAAIDHGAGDYYDELSFHEGNLYGALHIDQNGVDVIQLRLIDLVTGSADDVGPPIVNSDGHALLIFAAPQPGEYANYGASCGGLSLSVDARPAIGTNPNFEISGYSMPSATGGVTILGLTQIDPGLALAAIGAPGCYQRASLDVLTVFSTASSVAFVPAIPGGIPNNSALIGMELFGQAAAFDSAANAFGMITSNGVRMALGY